ncbi:MAG: DUF4097 family beta strand repeat protein [Acidobacteriota bacterium]|nr:DUF4097 family beta strand repeat protein [Acidobacteriota bacterium]
MRKLALVLLAITAIALPALASEATFERNLSVNGRVDLSVATGSGNVHITRGTGNQVHIFGRVHSSWGSNEARVREIAANPPIEQTGNIIRIGHRHENYRNISIDYEIQAPADSFLDASSGSGDIKDEGVGANSKLSTGSGNIHATGLSDGFVANTGSGDIYIDGAGTGDYKVQTGSGSIVLSGINGGLRAGTGSGNIKVTGAPTSNWKIETGSGNVQFFSGNSSFTLDASTGSGTVHTKREMLMDGSVSRHHVTGKVGGGGPTVRIETGSGDVSIE